MKMPALKRKQVRIYLDDESERRLGIFAGGVRTFSETQILSELVAAALEACEKAGKGLHFPLTFEVVDPPHPPSRLQLNETQTKKGK